LPYCFFIDYVFIINFPQIADNLWFSIHIYDSGKKTDERKYHVSEQDHLSGLWNFWMKCGPSTQITALPLYRWALQYISWNTELEIRTVLQKTINLTFPFSGWFAVVCL
jgi:hypothetical protein